MSRHRRIIISFFEATKKLAQVLIHKRARDPRQELYIRPNQSFETSLELSRKDFRQSGFSQNAKMMHFALFSSFHSSLFLLLQNMHMGRARSRICCLSENLAVNCITLLLVVLRTNFRMSSKSWGFNSIRPKICCFFENLAVNFLKEQQFFGSSRIEDK